MINLSATYRIQLHKDFNLDRLSGILDYLIALGVPTIYASPIMEAMPGSMHGYDATNPNRINPELGSEETLRNISSRLKKEGRNWLQDIVPNHMAFDTRNPWIMDLLEKGPQSAYARFFDCTWSDETHQGKIMVPFLGASLEEVIRKKELKITWQEQRIGFTYYEAFFPLQPLSYASLLQSGDKLPQALQTLLKQLPKTEDEKAYAEAWEEFRLQLSGLMKNRTVKKFMDELLEKAGNDLQFLQQLLEQQSYRLCYWQETDQRINYRRFFTINGLICLNMQDPAVFETFHEKIKTLLEENVIQALRVDHIDGLFQPSRYLQQLRNLSGEETPLYVEKILEPGEELPAEWPVEGTTGYDFLAMVNNLLTWQKNETQFTRFYRKLTKEHRSLQEQVHEKKAMILFQHMNGELENLSRLFRSLNLVDKRRFSMIRNEELKEAIGSFLVYCPVYRFYGDRFPLEEKEAEAVIQILTTVRRYNNDLKRAVDLMEEVLLIIPASSDEATNERIAQFYQRCMQFSGPLMAKGVEDTLMYTFNRYIAHNEVGDTPGAFGFDTDTFHQLMIERQQKWPITLNTTSTHDTKRGEDVRARLSVLTGIAGSWLSTIEKWMNENKLLKTPEGPDANDEYLIYQTLAGIFPYTGEATPELEERMQAYLQKALREAKTHSTWNQPDENYEAATGNFIHALLKNNSTFLEDLRSLTERNADHYILHSLAQVVLKFTCPGIPDVYQGCELWDLHLVDPDNRQPVDFELRKRWLDALNENADTGQLWQERKDGKIKLWLTKQLFELRHSNPLLFTSGEYIPLQTEGVYKDHVIAFARKFRQSLLVVALPMHTALICDEQDCTLADIDWKDTAFQLPEGSHEEWSLLLTGEQETYSQSIPVKELFRRFPLVLLQGQQVGNKRGAGVLLHLSSLPSAFGIGDMGPEAYDFAEFLSRSRQRYWQLLPLNPTEGGQGHSPYSSISSQAGNILFISPEILLREGLLELSDIQESILPNRERVEFEEALRIKKLLLEKAWQRFASATEMEQQSFSDFCEQEKDWLDDFALFVLLKEEKEGRPWYEWPDEFRFRKEESIEQLRTTKAAELSRIKWQQFIFFRQWKALKAYCNDQGIRLIGDLPFYVSYDSADVWSNPDLFALDEAGNRTGMAGVPPDDFSADGQLWGMPVFNWEVHREEGYRWWINRLKTNSELFDLIRLDHFRAFSAYWEVPTGETTARNGEWKPGPGTAFFEAVQEALGTLPFIAEDLGEIDQPVYELRDRFRMPGMKVLQFAFGGDMPRSPHIPHNYTEEFVVYTGTHDNNTTRGWFTEDAGEESLLALERYVGRPVSSAEASMVLSRMAYASVAATVILPMQDVLNLDGRARLNTPSSGNDNWSWRLLPGQVSGIAERNLRKWTRLYNRE